MDISLRYMLFGEDHGATSTVAKIGGAFGKLGNYVGGEFGDILDKLGGGIDKIGEHAHSMGAKLTGAGAIVGGLGVAFQMAGSREKQGAAQLNAAIDATGRAHKDYVDEIEKAIKANENYGFGAADTQQALMKLTAATNDPKVALEQMGTVANLAASQHEDLATAASQVARVYGGSGKVLKQYGIHLESAKLATSGLKTAESQHHSAVTALAQAQKHLSDLEAIDHGKKKLTISDQIALRNAHDKVREAQAKVHTTTKRLTDAQDAQRKSTKYVQDAVDELGKRLHGQSAAAVDSFGGHIRVLQTKIGDWTAQMGQKLGPALTIAGPSIMAVGTIIETNMVPAIGKWIASTAVSTAGMVKNAAIATATGIRYVAVAVATGVWTAAQWALNVALNANPVALIIIGIAALIAIIIVAWKHSQTFRTVVLTSLHGIEAGFHATVHAIQVAWSAVYNYVVRPVATAATWVAHRIGDIVGWFTRMPGQIGAGLGAVAGAITSPFRQAFNYIADAWNNTVGRLHWSVPSWIPGIGGHSISVPQLPHFARGVRGFAGGLAVINEQGPEVVRLPTGSDVFRSGTGPSSGGGVTAVHLHFHGIVGDARAVGKMAVEAIVAHQRGTNQALPIRVAG